MKHLVLIMTAACILGNTLMGASPQKVRIDFVNDGRTTYPRTFFSENVREKTAAEKKREQEQQLQRARTRVKQTKCLDRKSFFNATNVEIPESFDLACILALALEDFGVSGKEARGAGG